MGRGGRPSRPKARTTDDDVLQAPISSSGPIFVFAAEFRLHRAPNRISSSREFRLHGRFSSSNFVFAHNLSFSSLGTISSSKASEFRLQGGYETGTHIPGSMRACEARALRPVYPQRVVAHVITYSTRGAQTDILSWPVFTSICRNYLSTALIDLVMVIGSDLKPTSAHKP